MTSWKSAGPAHRLHRGCAPLGPSTRSEFCPSKSIVLMLRHCKVELFLAGIGKVFRYDQDDQVWLR